MVKNIKHTFTFFIITILMISLMLPFSSYAFSRENDTHNYEVTVIRYATEEIDGLRRYTCTICGYSYDEVIPATGHNWSEWVVDVEPTCENNGHRYRICTNYPGSPHTQEESLPALGHDFVANKTVNPTCTQEGYVRYTCTRCNESYTQILPMLSHNYQLVEEIKPTENHEGMKKYVCTLCGDSYTEKTPMIIGDNSNEGNQESIDNARQDENDIEQSYVEPQPIYPENAGKTQKDASFNKLDTLFVGSTAGTAALFSIFIAPYTKVLFWARNKKRNALAASKKKKVGTDTGNEE